MASADGDIALFSDADLSTPIEELSKLIDPINNGDFDVTIGSRALDRSLIGTHQPWRREQGGRVFNLFVRTLTGLPFWDTQCGFKAFNMEKFRPLLDKMTIDRFGFDVEFIYVADHGGLRIKGIPRSLGSLRRNKGKHLSRQLQNVWRNQADPQERKKRTLHVTISKKTSNKGETRA